MVAAAAGLLGALGVGATDAGKAVPRPGHGAAAACAPVAGVRASRARGFSARASTRAGAQGDGRKSDAGHERQRLVDVMSGTSQVNPSVPLNLAVSLAAG